MSQPQLPQIRAFCYEGCDGVVVEILAVVEVYLQDVAAVHGKGDDALVGELRASIQLESLEMAAVFCHGLERVVGNLLAVCDVQTLEADRMLCQGEHGAVGDGVDVCDVQRQQTPVLLEHGHEAQVGELGAVGQGQALDALAGRERLQGAVADLAAEGGQVEALDQAAVVEEAVCGADRVDDALDVGPLVGRGPVPQQADAVPRPVLGDEHAVLEVCGRRQLGEDGDHELGGQAGDGRDAVLLVDGAAAGVVVRVGRDRGRERRQRVVGLQHDRVLVVVEAALGRGRGGRVGARGAGTAVVPAGARHGGGACEGGQAEGVAHGGGAVGVWERRGLGWNASRRLGRGWRATVAAGGTTKAAR